MSRFLVTILAVIAQSKKQWLLMIPVFFLWTVFAKASCSAEMALRSGVLVVLYSLFLISGNVFSDITSFNDVCLVNIKFLSLFRNWVLLSQSKLKYKQMGKLKLLLRPQYWHRFMCPAYIYTRENLIVSWYIYQTKDWIATSQVKCITKFIQS